MKVLAVLLCVTSLLGALLAQETRKTDATKRVWHVRGRAIAEDGTAIPGACVAAGKSDAVVTAQALKYPLCRTEADGRFDLTIEAQGESSAQMILLTGTGLLSAQLDPRVVAARAQGRDHVLDFGSVVLARAMTLHATVRGENGAPIAGATVIALDALQGLSESSDGGDSSAKYLSMGITDEKGLVDLPGVASSGARVVVQADGYYEKTVPFVGEGDPIVVDLRAGGFVDGLVMDADGRPCNAWVVINYEVGNDERPVAQWVTGGKFRLNLRYPHRYRIMAFYGDQGSMRSMSPVLGEPARGVEVGAIRTEANGDASRSFLVRVTDSQTGEAVPGFKAAALWGGNDASDRREFDYEFEFRGVQARRPGEVRLLGPVKDEPIRGTVLVRAKGYAPFVLADVEWSDDPPPSLEVKLVRECVVSGVVVDEDSGQPIKGASIVLDEDARDRSWFPGSAQGEGGRITDDGGRFSVGDLAAGKHKLRALVFGRPVPDPIELELAPSSTRKDLKLVVPSGAKLDGRFAGAGVRVGSLVLLRQKGSSPSSGGGGDYVKAASVASDGSFTVRGLEHAEYEVVLLSPHRQGRGGWIHLPVKSIQIIRSEIHSEFDTSESVPGMIRGHVTLTGAAVSERRLFVAAYRDDKHGIQPWNVLSVCEPVAGDGSFEFPVAPGVYRIRVLDAATRVPLAISPETRVKAGGVVDMDLKQEIVRVKVHLHPEVGGGAIIASHLEMLVRDLGDKGRARFGNDGLLSSRSEVSLASGETELEILLPSVATRLRVKSNADDVLGSYIVGQTLAQHEFTPETGKAESVDLIVRAPPQPDHAKEK